MLVVQLVGRLKGQTIEMPFHIAQRCIAAGTARRAEPGSAVVARPPAPPSPNGREKIHLPKPPEEEPVPVSIVQKPDGLHLAGEWPRRTKFLASLLQDDHPAIRLDGDRLTLTLVNASATYRMVGEKDGYRIYERATPVAVAAEAPVPVKRGRGRPRKNPIAA